MHKIEVKPSYYRSLDRIYDWYLKIGVDPRYALRIENEAMAIIRTLSHFPNRFKKHPLFIHHIKDIRQVSLRQYFILFEVSPSKVDIIAIIPQKYSNKKIRTMIRKS